MDDLFSQLGENGYQARLVSIRHLPELQEEIIGRYQHGFLDEMVYRENLSFLNFSPPAELPHARTILIIAVPRPQHQIVFTWHGERKAFILPPTYVQYKKTSEMVENLVGKMLASSGYRVARAALPLKLLAVRSGLAAYGRNNVTYVPQMGSFHQLVGMYSDLPCRHDDWAEVQMLPRCEKCFACLHACPTGAITRDRFLLHAERCLVFYNEREGDFPAWIDPDWHNCLLGCMRCQQVCPECKDYLNWVEEGTSFSQQETELLLSCTSTNQFPATMIEKFQRLGLSEDLSLWPRNLKVLLHRSK